MGYFAGKVIWITGATSGIGFELAKLLAKQDARLVISARSMKKLAAVRMQLKNAHKHLILPLDLEDTKHFNEFAKQVIEYFDKIDILINNGGVSQRGEASSTSIEIDRKIMETNYFGNIALTKVVLPYFQKQKKGQIVVTSSIAGKFGFYMRSAYAASKHALHGFYESLALEEAKNNIAVTLIVPGKINTSISLNAINEKGKAHGEMDHNQATGMPAKVCAQHILSAIEKKKREVLIGGKETKAVIIKRFFPKLFWRIIKKQSAT